MSDATAESRVENLRFSRRLSILLTMGVVVLIAVVATSSIWMSRKHNELAAKSAHQMVAGAIEAKRDLISGFAGDYSYWDDAYEKVSEGDLEWMQSNMAIAEGEDNAFNVLVIVEPGGSGEFGWNESTIDQIPEHGLLSDDALDRVMRLMDDSPMAPRRAEAAFVRSNGKLFLLAITRIQPWEGIPEGVDDEQLHRLIAGFEVTDEFLAEMGAPFLISDLSLQEVANDAYARHPLDGPDGVAVGYIKWTMPKPGALILNQIMPVLGLALAIVAIIAFFASGQVVRSAVRLERALVAAQAADRSKTDFLTNVSHELRTPMNGVIGIGQLLGKSSLTAEQSELLNVLMTSAKSQMSLIDDLMDISRIESGKLTLDTAPFIPSEALAEVIALLEPKAAEKGLEWHVDMPGAASPQVMGDRDAFKQIFSNLIGNAIKFTESGMVSISMEQVERLGEMSFAIVVADTGPGIASKDHQMVFERFSQADSSTSRSSGGAGIGLSITKSLLDLMNGGVELRSTLGEGAKFTVRVSYERAPATLMTEAA